MVQTKLCFCKNNKRRIITRLRKQVAQLLERDTDLGAENALLLPQPVLACLQDALRAGMLQHDCHRSVTSFPYQCTQATSSDHVNECKVLSDAGQESLSFLRFLWSGNSRNHVPLAKLHPTLLIDEQRRQNAEAELKVLLADVEAEFNLIVNTQFVQELQQHVRIESFSTEGDELHQLVDCVVMGPYSASDLNSNVHAGD